MVGLAILARRRCIQAGGPILGKSGAPQSFSSNGIISSCEIALTCAVIHASNEI